MSPKTKNTGSEAGNPETQETVKLSCFIVMPITDVEPYSPGHFRRVYEHLIAPACTKAGFSPVLASDVKETNLIVLDILERLYSADMVLCDLSARNPNVLYELGFRQAFNRPVTLIKDLITERVFDIAGLRDIPYDQSLRVDTAQGSINEIAERMRATYDGSQDGGGGVNSLVQLLNIESAVAPERTELSGETQVILNVLQDVSDRLSRIESTEALGRSRRASRAAANRSEVTYEPHAGTFTMVITHDKKLASMSEYVPLLQSVFPQGIFNIISRGTANNGVQYVELHAFNPTSLTSSEIDKRLKQIASDDGAAFYRV